MKNFIRYFLILALLVGLTQIFPAQKVQAVRDQGEGAVCPAGNIKYEIDSGYEYDDGSATITASASSASWSATEGYQIVSACVKIGGPGGGSLIILGPGDELGVGPFSYGISHVVVYTTHCGCFDCHCPTPTGCPTPTPSESPSPSPSESPSPSPTDRPTPTPTESPSPSPTESPSPSPTESPTPNPTSSPASSDGGGGDSGVGGGQPGEVLGATTMASTGSLNDLLMLVFSSGALLSGIGIKKCGISLVEENKDQK